MATCDLQHILRAGSVLAMRLGVEPTVLGRDHSAEMPRKLVRQRCLARRLGAEQRYALERGRAHTVAVCLFIAFLHSHQPQKALKKKNTYSAVNSHIPA